MSVPADRGTVRTCLAFLFSAVTSAMQPARVPIALLAVLLLAALAPIVDLADGQRFGPRGFASGPLSATEVELGVQRARSAANRIAGDEVDRLDAAARDGGAAATRADYAAAVRDATARRIAERVSNGAASEDPELERIRDRAAEALLVIEESAPRGVATTFLALEGAAMRQVAASLVRLDLNAALGGVGSALVGLPVAAIRASPVIFPLAFIALACVLSILAGGSARMAAVHAGRGGRLTPLEGAGFARARAPHFVALPVLPLLVLGVLAAVVLGFTLLLRIPVLNVVAAVVFIVPVALALFGSVLAVTAIAAFPMMPVAVAVEDCDAGDAITRACALVLGRPLAWLGILAASVAVLVVGISIVAGVVGLAGGAIDVLLDAAGGRAGAALATGESSELAVLHGPDRLVGGIVAFWRQLLGAVAAAYVFTLACDLATRGYLWMRERIDGENPATIAGYGIR
ncbi:MAG: hypothetical protein RL325_281 [Planctomycetota bacterium]|jgi:hypothetical protein